MPFNRNANIEYKNQFEQACLKKHGQAVHVDLFCECMSTEPIFHGGSKRRVWMRREWSVIKSEKARQRLIEEHDKKCPLKQGKSK